MRFCSRLAGWIGVCVVMLGCGVREVMVWVPGAGAGVGGVWVAGVEFRGDVPGRCGSEEVEESEERRGEAGVGDGGVRCWWGRGRRRIDAAVVRKGGGHKSIRISRASVSIEYHSNSHAVLVCSIRRNVFQQISTQ